LPKLAGKLVLHQKQSKQSDVGAQKFKIMFSGGADSVKALRT
jgi:hypothetical protein